MWVFKVEDHRKHLLMGQLLKYAWTPALSLYKVILSLSSLLTDPNPADPLVPAIAREYKSNRKKHDATARDWVKQSVELCEILSD